LQFGLIFVIFRLFEEAKLNRMALSEREEDGEAEARLRQEMGQRIVRRRAELGLSQVELARRLRVERSRLGKWERGLHSPLLKQLAVLAKVLEMSTDELLTGEAPGAEPGLTLGSTDRTAVAGVVAILIQLLQPKTRAGTAAPGGLP
jgi:transcriptional regulator with XRE-family HTH domain